MATGIELPWLSGKVVALGRHYGIPIPANTFICTALKPYMNGEPA
jgi:2-dehydropantoate 2-reductase